MLKFLNFSVSSTTVQSSARKSILFYCKCVSSFALVIETNVTSFIFPTVQLFSIHQPAQTFMLFCCFFYTFAYKIDVNIL